jgi:hypothetical protein
MEKGEATPGEKHDACGETFFINSPFFTREREEVRFSILQEWALRHSRRGCHVTIFQPPRMGGKRCDNRYLFELEPSVSHRLITMSVHGRSFLYLYEWCKRQGR